MPWRWRNVRKANIPKHERDTFERYGESIIGAILVGGLTPRAPDLQAVYQNEEIISHARIGSLNGATRVNDMKIDWKRLNGLS